jgi:hypothetical protein
MFFNDSTSLFPMVTLQTTVLHHRLNTPQQHAFQNGKQGIPNYCGEILNSPEFFSNTDAGAERKRKKRFYEYPSTVKRGFVDWKSRINEPFWFSVLEREWPSLAWAEGHPLPSPNVVYYWSTRKDIYTAKAKVRCSRKEGADLGIFFLTTLSISVFASEPDAVQPADRSFEFRSGAILRCHCCYATGFRLPATSPAFPQPPRALRSHVFRLRSLPGTLTTMQPPLGSSSYEVLGVGTAPSVLPLEGAQLYFHLKLRPLQTFIGIVKFTVLLQKSSGEKRMFTPIDMCFNQNTI